MARKVISKECEEAVNRLLAARDSMPEEFEVLRPDIVRNILNDGGTRSFSTASIAATGYTNSLLFSPGMLLANVFSTVAQFGLKMGGMSGRMAAITALTGPNAELGRNMGRYFLSALRTGIASDISQDIQYVARQRGVSTKDLKEQAKRAYIESWAATDPNITQKDIDAFVDSINLSDEEVVRFVSDVEFMIGLKGVPESLRWMTVPQRAAVAIDEASKVLFRTLKISDLARKQAIKDAEKTGQSVNELHIKYFNEVMDVHNSNYNREFALAKSQEADSGFRGVRSAVTNLEKKSNEMFQDLFAAEDIPFEEIREFALSSTFQRRLPSGLIPDAITAINRAKTKTGRDFTLAENLKGLAATYLFPFAKTPYNIAVEGYTYTPIALLPFLRPKMMKKKRVIEGGEVTGYKIVEQEMPMNELLTRSAIGVPILLGITQLYSTANKDGLPFITGTPLNSEERRRWKQAGIPERSILINGVYVPYGRVEPIGTLLTYIADMHELLYRDRDFDDPEATPYQDMIEEAAIALYNSFLSKPILEGAVNFLDYFGENAKRDLARLPADFAKGYIPTGVSDLARIIDGEERIAEDGWSSIKQRIPFVRESLPLDTRQFEGVESLSSNAFEIITKMNFVTTNGTEVTKEIYRTDANIPTIDSKWLGIKLNGAELSLLRQLSAKYVNPYLGGVVYSDTYLMAEGSRRKRMLEYHASKAMNPGSNSALLKEFIQEGTKKFGGSWIKSLEARKFNQILRDKGLQDYYDYMEVNEAEPVM